MREIPITPGELDDTFNFDHGEETFRFRFWWSEEVQSWFMDLEGLTNDFALFGHMLSVGVNIFRPYTKKYGYLIVTGPEHDPVTLESFPGVHRMKWFAASEIDG